MVELTAQEESKVEHQTRSSRLLPLAPVDTVEERGILGRRGCDIDGADRAHLRAGPTRIADGQL